jgi:predicted dehydrogenase
MYTAQMAEFCDALREGRPPRPTGAESRVTMRVVEEAYRSAGLRAAG